MPEKAFTNDLPRLEREIIQRYASDLRDPLRCWVPGLKENWGAFERGADEILREAGDSLPEFLVRASMALRAYDQFKLAGDNRKSRREAEFLARQVQTECDVHHISREDVAFKIAEGIRRGMLQSAVLWVDAGAQLGSGPDRIQEHLELCRQTGADGAIVLHGEDVVGVYESPLCLTRLPQNLFRVGRMLPQGHFNRGDGNDLDMLTAADGRPVIVVRLQEFSADLSAYYSAKQQSLQNLLQP